MSWLNTVRETERTSPRTTLAFYAVFAGISFTGGAALVAALSLADAPVWALVGAAGVSILFVAVILVTVIALNVRAPEKLQLGQVSARDYSQITRTRAALGDKQSGLRPAASDPAISTPEDDIVDAEVIEDSEDNTP